MNREFLTPKNIFLLPKNVADKSTPSRRQSKSKNFMIAMKNCQFSPMNCRSGMYRAKNRGWKNYF